jgi:20S proteasome subunit beta 7
VDLLGVTYSASTLATGYGAYIAQPLLRKAVEGKENTLTQSEARAILENALRVLFYRDARSINQVQCLLPPDDLYLTMPLVSIK